MKKILIATSALVATAGMSAAQELNVSGSARFGIVYQEDATTTVGGNTSAAGQISDTRIEQRMRINLQGVTETDAGVKFEARFRLESNEDVDNSIAGRGPGAAGFAVSSGGFRLDIGNVSDVIDGGSVVNFYGSGVGFTSFIEQSSNFGLPLTGFGAGNQDTTTLTLQYAVGDFTAAASYSDDKNVTAVSAAGIVTENDTQNFQVGFGYNFGNYSAGIAFGSEDTGATTNDFWVASFGGDIGAVGFGILVGDQDTNADTAFGGYLSYDVGAATEIRFAFSDGGAAANTDTSVGIGVRHSLGGGVTLAGGIGQNAQGNSIADLGVTFSF